MTKKIGVIGLGKMGIMHLSILYSMEDVQITCVSDKVNKIGVGITRYLPGVKFYTDYKEMLSNENLDGVFITTPVFLHVEMATYCVKKKVPFFLEKPLSLSFREGQKLVRKNAESRVGNMVGYCKRQQNNYSITRKLIKSGELGRVLSYKATCYKASIFKNNTSWRFSKEYSGGGALMSFGSHLVDMLYWLFGDVSKVEGNCRKIYSKKVEDYCFAKLYHESGVNGEMLVNWSKKGYRKEDTKILIKAEKGCILVTNDSIKLLLREASKSYPKGITSIPIQEFWEGSNPDLGGYFFTKQDRFLKK